MVELRDQLNDVQVVCQRQRKTEKNISKNLMCCIQKLRAD